VTRRHAWSGSPFEARYGFSRAVRDGDHVHVAGTAPILPGGDVDPDAAAQARRCWELVLAALTDVGAAREHVIRTRMFITDAALADTLGDVHGEVFRGVDPAATMVVVAGLLDPRWVIEVEATALVRPI